MQHRKANKKHSVKQKLESLYGRCSYCTLSCVNPNFSDCHVHRTETWKLQKTFEQLCFCPKVMK